MTDITKRIGTAERFRLLLGGLSVSVFLIIWQIAPETGLVSSAAVSAPYDVMLEAARLIRSGELVDNIAISMGRILSGLFLAIGAAVPLGFLLGGQFRIAGKAVNPLLQLFSWTNPFAMLPVFITVLGLGEVSRVVMIFWVAVWPVLFGTITGIGNADRELVKMSHSFGLSKAQMFEKVLLPGALPSVFSGIRVAALFSFFVLIGAEMIGAGSGLGYMINNACPLHSAHQLDKMWAGIVTVAMLGVLINWVITGIERRFSYRKEDGRQKEHQ
ncbi:MAG: ABC transporter permease [Candidatus Methanoplasma sp.]|jgi:NitT/TauT family transport system permease protein|nr:ABC transporter permease [Candidatus Methanoplasma sp.]